jgi:hypothetical protein
LCTPLIAVINILFITANKADADSTGLLFVRLLRRGLSDR